MRDGQIIAVLQDFGQTQEVKMRSFQVEVQLTVKAIIDVIRNPPRYYLWRIPLWRRALTEKDFDDAFRDLKENFVRRQAEIIEKENAKNASKEKVS